MSREKLQFDVESDLATQKEVIEKIKKTISKDLVSALEWNRLEEGAAHQLKALTLTKLLTLLNDEKVSNEEVIQALQTAKKWIRARFLGESYVPGRGPWDEHSTSAGSRREAIVRCNVMRWEYQYLNRIIDVLEKDKSEKEKSN